MKNNNEILQYDDELDIVELFKILFTQKWKIVSITSFISIVGVIYSLQLPDIYESRALLAPANSSGGINNALKRYSGLAGIAGVSIPSSTEVSNFEKAIEKVSSLSFFQNHIYPNIQAKDILNVKSWDKSKNKIIYDKSISSMDMKPSVQTSYRAFRQHFNLIEKEDNGFVIISIKHKSPYVAKDWAELIVKKINIFYREKDKIESEKAIEYLNEKISTTNLTEVKQSISDLLQEEIQKLTLIEASEFYVFDYIDIPVVMEKKKEPNRAFICLIFAFFGGLISIIFVLFKHFYSNRMGI